LTCIFLQVIISNTNYQTIKKHVFLTEGYARGSNSLCFWQSYTHGSNTMCFWQTRHSLVSTNCFWQTGRHAWKLQICMYMTDRHKTLMDVVITFVSDRLNTLGDNVRQSDMATVSDRGALMRVATTCTRVSDWWTRMKWNLCVSDRGILMKWQLCVSVWHLGHTKLTLVCLTRVTLKAVATTCASNTGTLMEVATTSVWQR
jgi:hypothetical protein